MIAKTVQGLYYSKEALLVKYDKTKLEDLSLSYKVKAIISKEANTWQVTREANADN